MTPIATELEISRGLRIRTRQFRKLMSSIGQDATILLGLSASAAAGREKLRTCLTVSAIASFASE
jgi:hypothetical protein